MKKYCSSCKETKSKEEFNIANNRYDKCSVYCKKCTSLKSSIEYSAKIFSKRCKVCGELFSSTRNKIICSKKCRYAFLRKGIDGYKHCLKCKKLIPYRKTLKVRGYKNIASLKTKYCSKKCLLDVIRYLPRVKPRGPSPLKGVKKSKETRLKMSLANKGENHWNWKGGISPKNNAQRSCIELKEWRRKVFSRDNYTCVMCNQRGGRLEADHIKSWAKFPNLRFVFSNGRTLCRECHSKTPNYRGRNN